MNKTQIYKIKYNSQSVASLSILDNTLNPKNIFRISADSLIHVTPIESNLFSCRFISPKVVFSIDNNVDQEQSKLISVNLTKLFFIKKDDSGKIEYFQFAKDQDGTSRDYARMIMSVFQLSTPKIQKTKWESSEDSFYGKLTYTYKTLNSNLTKKHFNGTILKSGTKINLYTDSFYTHANIKNIESNQKINTYIEDKLISSENSTFSFTLLESLEIPQNINKHHKSIFNEYTKNEPPLKLSERRLSTDQKISMLNSIIDITKNTEYIELLDNIDSQTRLQINEFNNFANHIKFLSLTNKDAYSILKKIYDNNNKNETLLELLINALSNCDTENSSSLLSYILSKSINNLDTLIIFSSCVSNIKTPTKDLINIIMEISNSENPNIRNLGELQLGIISLNTIDSNKELSGSIFHHLNSKLQITTDPDHIGNLLLSLGNTKMENSIRIILPFLNNRNSSIQIFALKSLFGFKNKSVIDEITKLLNNTKNESVKSVALEILKG